MSNGIHIRARAIVVVGIPADNEESFRCFLRPAMNLLRRSSTDLLPWRISKRFMQSMRFPHGKPVESPPSTSDAAAPLANGVHVFQCPDSVGIVAKLSECIACKGGNILGADVFVPEKKRVFYSRSEFIFDPHKWPRKQMDEDFLELSKMFHAMRSVVRVPSLDPKYKIAILASKQEHCLIDLLHEWQDGRLPVDIASVISNHDRGPNTHVIRFLERHGIPYHCLYTTPGDKREEEILDLVQDTDFLVLARYMQILSGDFLRAYGKDIINIHHGLLPSFKGGYPSKQDFEDGVKLIGATSHFVTQELGAGPIIEQMVERVSHRDNLQSFVRKSENLEKQCLLKAIKSYCELWVLPYEAGIQEGLRQVKESVAEKMSEMTAVFRAEMEKMMCTAPPQNCPSADPLDDDDDTTSL